MRDQSGPKLHRELSGAPACRPGVARNYWSTSCSDITRLTEVSDGAAGAEFARRSTGGGGQPARPPRGRGGAVRSRSPGARRQRPPLRRSARQGRRLSRFNGASGRPDDRTEHARGDALDRRRGRPAPRVRTAMLPWPGTGRITPRYPGSANCTSAGTRFVHQHHHRDRTTVALHHQMRHLMSAKQAAVGIAHQAGFRGQTHVRIVQHRAESRARKPARRSSARPAAPRPCGSPRRPPGSLAAPPTTAPAATPMAMVKLAASAIQRRRPTPAPRYPRACATGAKRARRAAPPHPGRSRSARAEPGFEARRRVARTPRTRHRSRGARAT